MKLYDLERSGNCYKVRLLLAFLGQSYERVPVALDQGEQRRAEFLRLNPRGQIPVLVTDDKAAIWDSTAILVYLARRYGGEQWLPGDPLVMAQVMQWLALEQNEGRYGTARARVLSLGIKSSLGQSGTLEESRRLAEVAFAILEERLSAHSWLAADHPTIADIACYPYTALYPESGVSLDSYPAIRAWFRRLEAWPGYIALPRRPAPAAR
ncbi:glutathione S-transferase family protein [Acidiferrobacter sp.]|uniref:glutathione S-transferase family protein n=1 Tax=Acidiferrobacter sp. TaxID=1872107 RepID=UPI00260A0369|nr:glutathione S-transferase family protein [Acidiferrobacter sp.]